ncbi:MAG: LysM peptidoglycan-binding domain-containing protein [Alkalispirochaeta sp.]
MSTGLSAQIFRHEVQDGETLYGIARRYGVSPGDLTEQNGIASPDLLLPGTLLTIPNRYTVERGDTLYSIARRYDTTVEALTESNGLSTSSIREGQILTLPEDASIPDDARIATNNPQDESDDDASSDPAPEDRDKDAAEEDRDGPETQDDRAGPTPEPIVVAAEVSDPLSYADGGAWPVAGARRTLNGKLPGVLIRAERGTPVYAISTGRVVYAGPHTTFGNVVFIQSSQDYVYVYGGQETLGVEVGELVEAGSPIGTVGLSPSEGTAALYFSVWRNDRFVDPESAPRG